MQASTKPVVLIVDDAPDNLMLINMLLQAKCQVLQASSGVQALRLARAEPRPELILLDVLMPEMDGYQVCAELKQDPASADIPVIFLTSRNQADDQKQGFQVGAVDYITKPINPDVLQARVATHLQLQALRSMLSRQQHYQDPPPNPHTLRLQHYVAALARQLQDKWRLRDEQVTAMFHACAWHDAHARLHLPVSNPEQAGADFDDYVRQMNQAAHERFDGSGLPQGLSGAMIPPAARLLHVARMYDFLHTSHACKPGLPAEQVLALLRTQGGKQFDQEVVDAACKIADQLLLIANQYP